MKILHETDSSRLAIQLLPQIEQDLTIHASHQEMKGVRGRKTYLPAISK